MAAPLVHSETKCLAESKEVCLYIWFKLSLDFTAQNINGHFSYLYSVQRPAYFHNCALHIFTSYLIPPKTTLHMNLHLDGHE